MATISEALAVSALEKRTVPCPFSASKKHAGNCVCRGSMKVSACDKCAGSGWDAVKDLRCQACGGCGAQTTRTTPAEQRRSNNRQIDSTTAPRLPLS